MSDGIVGGVSIQLRILQVATLETLVASALGRGGEDPKEDTASSRYIATVYMAWMDRCARRKR